MAIRSDPKRINRRSIKAAVTPMDVREDEALQQLQMVKNIPPASSLIALLVRCVEKQA
jgi:hypothetical protein